MEEAQKELDKLKALITKPLVLALLEPGETLLLYSTTTTQVISVALVVEWEEPKHVYRVQRLVYYINKVRSDCETRYNQVQKLLYTILIMKHKLLHYFECHSIPVVTDKTWIPDLLKGSDNYRFGWIRDTPIRLQIQRNEPCNLSTTNPLVINLAAARLTSPRRLTLACESKNTSKCTEKHQITESN
jgi:hypothetical protein